MKNMNDDLRTQLLDTMQDISVRVSGAICPIDRVSMPLSAIVLENYAQMLKNRPEFDRELYIALKSTLRCVAFVCDENDSDATAAVKNLMREANRNKRRDR